MSGWAPAAGVLLVAHGTVESLDDMPAFLTRVRHGRPPPEALVAELRRRYAAIGGSPLLRLTREQAAALEARLGIPVLLGMRLWDPSVEAALREAAAQGVGRLCLLPLAPFSVAVYAAAAERSLDSLRAELGPRTPELLIGEAWGERPEFCALHAERIRVALSASGRAQATVLLTAHSLPARVIRDGDRYQLEVEAAAGRIAQELGVPCRLAYQSQGADGGEWLGPDLRQVLAELAASGVRDVILSPFGFVSDHVETLYDLDIEARALAKGLGIELQRLAALNTHPGLIELLAQVASRALGR